MFSLEKVTSGIYHLSFSDQLELNAHFLRWQEIYESDDLVYYNKPFQLFDFIKSYSKKKGGDFTYFTDWAGFNITTEIVSKFYPLITDVNDHDRLMFQIVEFIKKDNNNKDCYLIGSKDGSLETLKHEVAHGLYYSRDDYKDMMDDLIDSLPKDVYNESVSIIKNMGYNEHVIDDEIQAYFSTGLPDGMSDERFRHHMKRFEKQYKNYCEKFNIYEKSIQVN